MIIEIWGSGGISGRRGVCFNSINVELQDLVPNLGVCELFSFCCLWASFISCFQLLRGRSGLVSPSCLSSGTPLGSETFQFSRFPLTPLAVPYRELRLALQIWTWPFCQVLRLEECLAQVLSSGEEQQGSGAIAPTNQGNQGNRLQIRAINPRHVGAMKPRGIRN